jgi:hypothetical protein
VHQSDDDQYVNTGLYYDLGIQSGPVEIQAGHEYDAGRHITNGCPQEQLLVIIGRPDELVCPAVEVERQK